MYLQLQLGGAGVRGSGELSQTVVPVQSVIQYSIQTLGCVRKHLYYGKVNCT